MELEFSATSDREVFELQVFEQAIDWVMDAGNLIKGIINTDQLAFQAKTSHSDLVTEVDRKVEGWLVEKITKSFPDHSIMGEENINNRTSSSEYLWIIDPIDGTSNMINRNQEFAVSVALCTANRAVFGIVYDVMGDKLFRAFKGKGAFVNNRRLSRLPDRLKLENELIAITLPWHRTEEWSEFKALISKARGIRFYGATTMELCDIALRKLGAYVQYNVKAWDYAASRVILEELGCKFSDLQGREIGWVYHGGVVAAPPEVHEEIIGTLGLG
ncbi:inositol monophosphatase family protein [Paenibacillus harenae]|uniref:inositol monophosphatase family protein n=1 Tax=Paenibacillus harenae TaxID=306543 RepID=UPI00040E36CF|nr:inositol monophosphatase [Paenibacillus harenae]